MKALFWGENFLPFIGGAEIMLSQLIPALAQRGIECQIITSRHRPELAKFENWNGISLHRLDFHKAIMGDLRAFSEIRKHLIQLYQDFRPDLVHVHTTGPSLFFELQTHRDFKVPRFLTIHAFFSYPPKEDGYFRKYLPGVDYLSGVSRRMLDMALALFPPMPPPHQLIYNGVKLSPDTSEFPSTAEEIILSLGRLSREKGIDLGIRALGKLRRVRPQAKLWIAGEGFEREALQDLVKSLDLDDNIVFMGGVAPEKVYQLMARCRFLIMPSRFDEGLPFTALQAAHMGKPLIGARRGGLPEIVRDGETGLLVDEEDWEGLASAMDRLLANPPLCERLGQQAQELVRKEFDFTSMVDQYEEIYRQLTGRA